MTAVRMLFVPAHGLFVGALRAKPTFVGFARLDIDFDQDLAAGASLEMARDLIELARPTMAKR